MLTLDAADQAWLDAYRHELRTRHPGVVKRLVIYGSKARGDAREDSDLNVLIVVRNDASDLKRPLRRIGYGLAVESWSVPSILALTQAEWDRLKEIRSPFPESVERDGVSVL